MKKNDVNNTLKILKIIIVKILFAPQLYCDDLIKKQTFVSGRLLAVVMMESECVLQNNQRIINCQKRY